VLDLRDTSKCVGDSRERPLIIRPCLAWLEIRLDTMTRDAPAHSRKLFRPPLAVDEVVAWPLAGRLALPAGRAQAVRWLGAPLRWARLPSQRSPKVAGPAREALRLAPSRPTRPSPFAPSRPMPRPSPFRHRLALRPFYRATLERADPRLAPSPFAEPAPVRALVPWSRSERLPYRSL
jgi:hypothetical protein